MKVAMIEPVCAHGAMDYYDFSLCKGLLNAGLEVRLYVSDAGPLAPEGIEVLETYKGMFGNAPKLLRAVKWANGLRKSIANAQQFEADIIHFHFFDSGILERLNLWYAKRTGRPVIATIHDVQAFNIARSKTTLSNFLSQLDGIIVHNETSKKEVISLIDQKDVRIAVIPHGHYIDFIGNKIEMSEARKAINVPDGYPVFLFFGYIKRVKGLDIAIRALSVLVKTIPNAKLLVAGKFWKDDRSHYDKLISDLSLEDNIIFHIGHVPQNMVSSYYHACNAVILPYKRIYQSGVLLMAMSYGKAVIASDLPGMLEVINDGENGMVFRSEDPGALAKSMQLLIDEPQIAEKLGHDSVEYVKSNYDWNKIGEKTGDFYINISKDKRLS